MATQDDSQDKGKDEAQDNAQDDFDLSDYVKKSDFDQMSADLKKWKNKARELTSKTISDEERDEYEQLKAEREQAEEEKKMAKGQFQELKEKLEQKHANEVAKLKEQLTKRDSKIADLLVTKEIVDASSGKAQEPSVVAKLLKDNFKVTYDDTGEPHVTAYKDSGGEWLDDDGNPATIGHVVDKFLEDKAYLAPNETRRGAGSRSNTSEDARQGKVPTIDEQNRMSPEKLAEVRATRPSLVRGM